MIIFLKWVINFPGASTQTPQGCLPPASQERGISPNLTLFGIRQNTRVVNNTVTGKFTNSFCIPIVPLPEGNTRLTVTFCCQFIESKGIPIDRTIFEKHSAYVRTALVAYSAGFDDLGDLSQKGYLERIIGDSLFKR